jgi:hypothetical protein
MTRRIRTEHRPDAWRVIGNKRTPDRAPTLASGLSGLSTHKGWGGLPPYRPILRPPR